MREIVMELAEPAACLELLRKGEVLSRDDPPSLAVTYNNLACYFHSR